jgi:hypothetical protein
MCWSSQPWAVPQRSADASLSGPRDGIFGKSEWLRGKQHRIFAIQRTLFSGWPPITNVYGVVCVGIGCELNTMDSVLESLVK